MQPHLQGPLLQGTPMREGREKQDGEEKVKGREERRVQERKKTVEVYFHLVSSLLEYPSLH